MEDNSNLYDRLFWAAVTALEKGKIDNADRLLREARKHVKTEADRAACLEMQASVFQCKKMYESASGKLQEALAIYRRLEDHLEEFSVLLKLGFLYEMVEDLDDKKAVMWYRKALGKARELEDTELIGSAQEHLDGVTGDLDLAEGLADPI